VWKKESQGKNDFEMNGETDVYANGHHPYPFHTMERPNTSSLSAPESASSSNSSTESLESEAYIVACDYIKYRLGKEGFDWRDCPQLPDPPTRLCRVVRSLCDELESAEGGVIPELTAALPITPSIAYKKYMEVATALFEDKTERETGEGSGTVIRWGRIVALFTFGGALAVRCLRERMPQLIGPVTDWTAIFVEMHLNRWIQEHGGWEGMVSHFEQVGERVEWSTFKRTMAGVGAVCGVVGAVTLGSLFVAKG
jgi:BCL2-like 1 (apoptosis regulator Bcl-X)